MSNGPVDLQMAIADLNASRARLREVLVPPPADPNAPKGKSMFSGIADGIASLWSSLKGSGGGKGSASKRIGGRFGGSFGGLSVLSLAVDALQSWWASHPWRQIGSSVAAPLGVAAVPLVRRYPWSSMIAASAVGALFITIRPWRWRLVSQQAHLVRRQAVRWALGQAAKPAFQAFIATAVAGLLSNLNQKKSSAASTSRAAAAGGGAAAVPMSTQVGGHGLHAGSTPVAPF